MSTRPALFLTAMTMLLVPTWGQNPPKHSPIKVAESEPFEGLWPSPKLMNSLLLRWADNISDQYELDDEQRVKVHEAVVRRWSRFLNENRATIQPLFNEYLEMRMELEAPPREAVQAWAKRAMPVFKQFREQIDGGTDDFRKVLSPLQRAKFELEALRLGVGMQVAEQRLKRWEEGEFDPKEVWTPPRARRRERDVDVPAVRHERIEPNRGAQLTEQRHPQEEPKPQAESPKTDQIAIELQAWERYVVEFIRIYDLDEGQRSAALSCLSELKKRALDHRDRRRDDIAALEYLIEHNSGTEQELSVIKKQLTQLYGPVDEMFGELKHRIELIPTTEQRARAAKGSGRQHGRMDE